MKHRFTLLAAVAMLFCGLTLFAQDRTIIGKITADDGSVLPGVNITLRGSNRGANSTAEGTYQISAPSNAVLVFSFIGFKSQEITVGNQSVINVKMVADASQLQEVVVTAQGIRKSQREINYSYAKVANEDIMLGRAPRLAQALAGKVTGLAVYNVNNSVDPSVKVVLRGYRSLTGNNEALVVVDGMQTTSTVLALINPNDIESVTVLKGGQAATLYGSAGINGAIVITTKKGAKGKLKVNYSNSTNFEEISFLPQFQDKYGSGSHYSSSFGSAGYLTNYTDRMKENWRPYENQQYGDAFDGSMRIQGRVLEDGSKLEIPYSAIDNVRRKTFDRGVSMNNQINFEGGDETTTFRLALENQKIAGIVPKDKSDRTGIRFAASKEYKRLTASFTANYTQAKYDRTSSDFYNDVLNQPANLPLYDLRDWQNNKFANPNGYYNDYYNNPYFNKDINRNNYKDANISSNIALEFRATDWLRLVNRLGVMNNSRTGKNYTSKFLYTDWAKTKAFVPAPWGIDDVDGTGIYRAISDILGGVADYSSTENVINNEFQAHVNKDFGDFKNNLILGGSVYQRYTKAISISSSSIVVPDVYNVSNRQGILGGGEGNTMERRFGYYADVTSNYKNWLILNASGRYDATSRFYKPTRDKNYWSYLYYGAGLSFIPTDAFPGLKSNVLSFAKVRMNYNKNANDNIPLYGLDLTYPNGSGFPFGNTVGLTVGNTLPDANLKPEIVYSGEIGAELQMFNNRVNFEFSAYSQTSKGQVITVRVPNTTGFSNLLINVGETKNWGYEGEFKYLIARGTKLNWDFSVRYSYNDNKVIDLYPGINEFQYGGFTYATTNVIKGERFPTLKTNGYTYAPDGSGYVLVNPTTGYPILNTALVNRGGTLPRHIAGLGSKVSYGNLTFNFNFEYRGGNMMFSDLGRQMTFTGSGKWTENRNPQMVPNSATLNADGKTVTPNTTINVRESEYGYWVDNYRLISENFVTPGWFIKLRDINLAYTLPTNLLERTKIFSRAEIAFFGRNLFTIVDKKNYYTDPEFSNVATNNFTGTISSVTAPSAGNNVGINTTGQTPPVRQYGVSLNLTF